MASEITRRQKDNTRAQRNSRPKSFDRLNNFEKKFGGGQDTSKPPFLKKDARLEALRKRTQNKES